MRFLPLALLGCPSADPEPPPEPLFLGADPTIPALEGEARAGVVRDGEAGEAALFGGVNAEGRAGDVKVYNHRVQFVIQGAYESHGVVDVGGGIIDADRVRTDGSLGRDTTEDVFLAFGVSRLFHADSVEIVSDGSDGGDAVVVARGRDVVWKYLQGLLELDEPLIGDLHLDIAQTYRLPPDSDALTLTTALTNGGDSITSFVLADGLFLSGEDMQPWASGRGFAGPETGVNEAVLFTGKSGEATLSMWPEDGEYTISGLAALTGDLGINLAELPEVFLEPGETVTVVRTVMLAADPASAEAERRASRDEVLVTVSGAVRDDTGGVAGARVHFVDASGSVAGFARSASDGSWSARLVPGDWTAYVVAHHKAEHVELPSGSGRYGPYAAASVNARQLAVLAGDATAAPLAHAAGRRTPDGAPFHLEPGEAVQVDFELEAQSLLEVAVEDDAGATLPAVVEVRWAGPVPPSPVPVELHEALAVPDGARAAWAWTAGETLRIPVLPGSYDLGVDHSWRYGRAAVPGVAVGVGEVASRTVVLEEVVARDGWLAMDNHLHGAPSFDGALPMEDRLVTCAATGVDLPVSTDHDAVGDYRPIASALGLADRMTVIPGFEVTTLLRGHFNVYPVDPAPLTKPNGGAEPWWITPDDTDQLFARIRESAGPDALIQVNHPRAPGMFGFGAYDAETGAAGDPEYFSWEFDAFELLNGGGDDFTRIREDWFSFLDEGRIRTPVGASDSHYRFIPCGLARTDVFLDATNPAEVSAAEVRAALLAGNVVVASGTTLRAQATAGQQNARPGDTLSGGSFRLDVQVRTPDWISPGTLRVYRNGEVVSEQVLETAVDGVWFDDGWDLETEDDAWYAVEVEGDQALGDVWRDHLPYAMTNAFFIDVDGVGWTPPGR